MNKYFDNIKELPSDEIPLNDHETHIINMLFIEDDVKKEETTFIQEIIDPIIVGILFVIFSSPFVNSIISSETTDIVKVVIKTIFVILMFWLIKKIKK